MPESHRRLPHIYPEGKWLFITWHLYGNLPPGLYPPPGKRNGEAFVWMDRYLDTVRSGPMYLRRKDVAQIMIRQLRLAVDVGHCVLHAYVFDGESRSRPVAPKDSTAKAPAFFERSNSA